MMENVVWCINVYDRFPQLKLQQDILRYEFGKELPIFVYCNNEITDDKDITHRENLLIHEKVNGGHHTGVRDAYNAMVDKVKNFDYVIWSHADAIFDNCSFIPDLIKNMKTQDIELACLELFSRLNPRRHDRNECPYMFNDFFVIKKDLYTSSFPQRETCDGDGDDCIEVSLARWLKQNMKKEPLIIKCRENYPQKPGGFNGDGWFLIRDNDFDLHKKHLKDTKYGSLI